MTWVSQAWGAVPWPWVCPACGTTHAWTVAGEAAWNHRACQRPSCFLTAPDRAATGSLGMAPAAMISTGYVGMRVGHHPHLQIIMCRRPAPGRRFLARANRHRRQ